MAVACKSVGGMGDDGGGLSKALPSSYASSSLSERVARICPGPEPQGKDIEHAVARCYTYQQYPKITIQLLGICETFIILDGKGVDVASSEHMELCIDSYAESHRPLKRFVVTDFAQSLAEGRSTPQSSFSAESPYLSRKYQRWHTMNLVEKLDLCVNHLSSREWAYFDKRTDPKDVLEYGPLQHYWHRQASPAEGLNYVPRDCDGSQQSSMAHEVNEENSAEINKESKALLQPVRAVGESLDNAVAKCSYYVAQKELKRAKNGLCEVFTMIKKQNRRTNPMSRKETQRCLEAFPSSSQDHLAKVMQKFSKYIEAPPSSRRHLYRHWYSRSLSAQIARCSAHISVYD